MKTVSIIISLVINLVVIYGTPCGQHNHKHKREGESGGTAPANKPWTSFLPGSVQKPVEQFAGNFQGINVGGQGGGTEQEGEAGSSTANPMTSFLPEQIKKPFEQFTGRKRREESEQKPDSGSGPQNNSFTFFLPGSIQKPIEQFAGNFQGLKPSRNQKESLIQKSIAVTSPNNIKEQFEQSGGRRRRDENNQKSVSSDDQSNNKPWTSFLPGSVQKPVEQFAGNFQGINVGGQGEGTEQGGEAGSSTANPMTSFFPEQIKKPFEQFTGRKRREESEQKPESGKEPWTAFVPDSLKKPVEQFAGNFQGINIGSQGGGGTEQGGEAGSSTANPMTSFFPEQIKKPFEQFTGRKRREEKPESEEESWMALVTDSFTKPMEELSAELEQMMEY